MAEDKINVMIRIPSETRDAFAAEFPSVSLSEFVRESLLNKLEEKEGFHRLLAVDLSALVRQLRVNPRTILEAVNRGHLPQPFIEDGRLLWVESSIPRHAGLLLLKAERTGQWERPNLDEVLTYVNLLQGRREDAAGLEDAIRLAERLAPAYAAASEQPNRTHESAASRDRSKWGVSLEADAVDELLRTYEAQRSESSGVFKWGDGFEPGEAERLMAEKAARKAKRGKK